MDALGRAAPQSQERGGRQGASEETRHARAPPGGRIRRAKKAAEEAEAARKAAAAAATAAAKKEAEEAQRKAEEAAAATKKAAEEAEVARRVAEAKAAAEAEAAAKAKAAAEAKAKTEAEPQVGRVSAADLLGGGGVPGLNLQRRSTRTSNPSMTSIRELTEEEKDEAEHRSRWFTYVKDQMYHRVLMCKGVEWGFQYHNFYGDWTLSADEPLCHDRPHYVHNTMYGGFAHLFHVIDPHYHVPRWVIGPAPGNENGWAFCESDAMTPWEVATCWISWDGFEWHTCRAFKFVAKEDDLDGLTDDEGEFFEEEDEEVFADFDRVAGGGGVKKLTSAEYEEQLTARQSATDTSTRDSAGAPAAAKKDGGKAASTLTLFDKAAKDTKKATKPLAKAVARASSPARASSASPAKSAKPAAAKEAKERASSPGRTWLQARKAKK